MKTILRRPKNNRTIYIMRALICDNEYRIRNILSLMIVEDLVFYSNRDYNNLYYLLLEV